MAYHLILQDDRNVVIYGTDGTALWQTDTIQEVTTGWGEKLFDQVVPLPFVVEGATATVKVYERRVSVGLGFLGLDFQEHSVTQGGPNSFHYSYRMPSTKHKFFFAVHFDLKRLDFVYTMKIADEKVIHESKIGLVTW